MPLCCSQHKFPSSAAIGIERSSSCSNRDERNGWSWLKLLLLQLQQHGIPALSCCAYRLPRGGEGLMSHFNVLFNLNSSAWGWCPTPPPLVMLLHCGGTTEKRETMEWRVGRGGQKWFRTFKAWKLRSIRSLQLSLQIGSLQLRSKAWPDRRNQLCLKEYFSLLSP